MSYEQTKVNWDLVIFSTGLFVTLNFWLTPLWAVTSFGYRLLLNTQNKINTREKLERNIPDGLGAVKPSQLAPNLRSTPDSKGEIIAGYAVTSLYGLRPVPRDYNGKEIPGASTNHRGVDLATPIGTPVYLLGLPGSTAEVRCWDDDKGGGLVAEYSTELGDGNNYTFKNLHLSRCAPGTHRAGSLIARTGDTGIGAAHLDFRVLINGEYVAPPRWAIWSALTGNLPQSAPK